jgi:quinol monooxygenase YgiN
VLYKFESKKALDDYRKSPEFTAVIAEMQGTWKGEGFDIK